MHGKPAQRPRQNKGFKSKYPNIEQFAKQTESGDPKKVKAHAILLAAHGEKGGETIKAAKQNKQRMEKRSGRSLVSPQGDSRRHIQRSQDSSFRPGPQSRRRGGNPGTRTVIDLTVPDPSVPGGRRSRGTLTTHTTAKSFRTAVNAPLSRGGHWRGAEYHEMDGVDSQGRYHTIAGREWLGSVDQPPEHTGGLSVGDHFPRGIYYISPTNLGGRLALLAQDYEQHEMVRMTVRYAPLVAATTNGGVAMVYTSDVGTPISVVGDNNYTHAATHDSFQQISVWEEGSIAIRPSDTMLKYFDEEAGDFRLETQGFVSILAGSTIHSTASGEDALTYGNLFVEYEFRFFTPSLDYDVTDIYIGSFDLMSLNEAVITRGNNIVFDYVPAFTSIGTYPQITTALALDQGLENYVFVCTVRHSSTSTNLFFNDSEKWTSRESDFTASWQYGQGVILRFSLGSGATNGYYATFYDDLASAQMTSISSDVGTNGQMLWSTLHSTDAGPRYISLDFRAFLIGDAGV